MNNHFSTQLSTKFAALALALTINGAMIGGVAYLFSGVLHDQPPAAAFAELNRSLPADGGSASL